ncbi:MAG: iron-sulfur cluster assembly scaffold protein [candidate division Zixibacteria bacterium]|nr:iron-sulfur cluster assembly scaffold protein [candidate division Zixibacteria bacterium]MDH3938229.1 iron-sulfur cluster assembly scaffold protein [candidate division Zixibacteria bacterium]MDH4032907.1 iron-sulfur cluster assembly scaffold protein [candidate division Zixibacteria bacterium]
MYNETVMKHFANPRNTGEIDEADGVGTVGNPNCGDMMKLYIRVVDGRLVEVKYKTFGCAAAIASSSVASELVKGKSLEQALSVKAEDIVDLLDGLPDEKVACSVIAPDAIRAAVEDYRKKAAGNSPT